ncbi:hypothetical protein GCM10010303_65980 [Streptomyces purpurascens]|nr:hypothetical protein GCM10010303_65980 [Streptomyces purpurascens]
MARSSGGRDAWGCDVDMFSAPRVRIAGAAPVLKNGSAITIPRGSAACIRRARTGPGETQAPRSDAHRCRLAAPRATVDTRVPCD